MKNVEEYSGRDSINSDSYFDIVRDIVCLIVLLCCVIWHNFKMVFLLFQALVLWLVRAYAKKTELIF